MGEEGEQDDHVNEAEPGLGDLFDGAACVDLERQHHCEGAGDCEKDRDRLDGAKVARAEPLEVVEPD